MIYIILWWRDNKFFENIRVQKVFSVRYKKYSDNSYAFQIKNDEGNIIDNKNISKLKCKCFDSIYKKLTEIFDIEDKDDRFKKKLKEACGGSGSEQRKITTLHSSSLCALLFFYNVSEENQLTLTIDSKKITFIDVLFEFQNTVIKGGKPSNVDVVLLGKDDNNDNKVILFLESKFSEYLDVSSQFTYLGLDYLREYECIYNDDFLKNIGFSIIKNEKEPKVFKKKKNGKIKEYNGIETTNKSNSYIEGVKQMISHYIGINNLLEEGFHDKKDNHIKLQKLYVFLDKGTTEGYEKIQLDKKELMKKLKQSKVYLGEILFDFHNMNIGNKEDFYNYSDKYTKLAENLKVLEDKNKSRNKIIVLPQLLTYSLFKDNKENSKYKIEHKIEDKIKEYYKLN